MKSDLKSVGSRFSDGLIFQNPVTVLLLGMCPVMAVSVSVFNGIGMGLSATFVLIFSNTVISLLRKFIPENVRIAAYIVVIATFVTIVDMLLQAFFPQLSKSLGLFIPLIVVNCIILARAEAFARVNGVFNSALDGLAMGIGFTAALIAMSVVREALGAGTLLGVPVMPPGFRPALLMGLAPGGFITLGFIIAAMQWALNRRKRKGKL
ncbi:MAG: electron transport complex subunit E [Oscillospiraceae bacterium]|nr:electron transport complex subunit E [Oscillospiraceae bacterium]